MFWTIITAVLVLILLWVTWRFKNRKLIAGALKFPGPKTLPFLGNAMHFMSKPEDQIALITNIITEFGDAVRFWLGPDLNIIISNPADVKTLLSSPKTSAKGPQYKYMADIIGGGILSGSGPTWRQHRKLAAPYFASGAIEEYTDVFNSEIDHLLESYKSICGKVVDVYRYNVKSTTYSVCQGIMGLTKSETMSLPHLQEVIDYTPKMYDVVFNRMTRWYLQINPIFWLTDSHRVLKSTCKYAEEFSRSIIKRRRDMLKVHTHNANIKVLDKFILSETMTDDELWKETFTIFTASQEAAAKIISFMLLMLAYHPHCQEKLYAEVKSIIGNEDRWVYGEDLKRMPYLDMVFKEVIRMFPIGAMIQRTVLEEISISSGTLPAGSSLIVPIYHIQRDPRFWTNPDSFDPERFSPEISKTRDPNCFIPFSLGPMDCLGRYSGTRLVKMIAVRAVRKFQFSSVDTYEDLKLYFAISAKSLNGYRVIIEPRK